MIAPMSSQTSKKQNAWPGVIAAYRDRVDVAPGTPPVTLLEGNTPLIPAPRLAELFGGKD